MGYRGKSRDSVVRNSFFIMGSGDPREEQVNASKRATCGVGVPFSRDLGGTTEGDETSGAANPIHWGKQKVLQCRLGTRRGRLILHNEFVKGRQKNSTGRGEPGFPAGLKGKSKNK